MQLPRLQYSQLRMNFQGQPIHLRDTATSRTPGAIKDTYQVVLQEKWDEVDNVLRSTEDNVNDNSRSREREIEGSAVVTIARDACERRFILWFFGSFFLHLTIGGEFLPSRGASPLEVDHEC